MKNNYALVWLTIITLLAILGGAVILGVALFSIQNAQNVDLAGYYTFSWIGGSMIGFGLLSMLFALTAGAVASAINNLRA